MISEPEYYLSRDYGKWLVALISVYILAMLSTAILANRTISIDFLGMYFLWPGGMFIFPIVFVILDIVTETYGYVISRLLIVSGVFMQFLFASIGTVVTNLDFPVTFKYAHEYKAVFQPTLWYVVAGTFGALVAEFINSRLLFKWKILYKGKYFLFRSLISSAVGQIALSFVVLLMMFHGQLNEGDILYMALSGWAYKMLFIVAVSYPSLLIVNHLKSLGINSFLPVKTLYNPFSGS